MSAVRANECTRLPQKRGHGTVAEIGPVALLAPRYRRADYRVTIVTEALADNPFVSVAIPPIVCVPCDIFFFCHVAEQEATLVHAAKGVPSAVIVIDLMPFAEFADTVILALPFNTLPFVGELIATLGAGTGAGAGVVTDTPDDWADVLPAAS